MAYVIASPNTCECTIMLNIVDTKSYSKLSLYQSYDRLNKIQCRQWCKQCIIYSNAFLQQQIELNITQISTSDERNKISAINSKFLINANTNSTKLNHLQNFAALYFTSLSHHVNFLLFFIYNFGNSIF